MPIAKKQIRDGFTVIANPGGYVSKATVKAHGWEHLVDDGPDLGGPAPEPAKADKPAPKKAGKAAP